MNKPEKEWTAKNVANAILADKATGRVASGQKISLAEVDNAVKEEKEDGTTYYYYEYISQGSPNSKEGEATTYRHARGVTAVRDGFAYTVSMSTPERFWDGIGRGVQPIYSRVLLRRAWEEVQKTRRRRIGHSPRV